MEKFHWSISIVENIIALILSISIRLILSTSLIIRSLTRDTEQSHHNAQKQQHYRLNRFHTKILWLFQTKSCAGDAATGTSPHLDRSRSTDDQCWASVTELSEWLKNHQYTKCHQLVFPNTYLVRSHVSTLYPVYADDDDDDPLHGKSGHSTSHQLVDNKILYTIVDDLELWWSSSKPAPSLFYLSVVIVVRYKYLHCVDQ